jgi:hypothetical protein
MTVSNESPAAAVVIAPRSTGIGRYVLPGLAFVASIVLVEICDAANDIFRGNINPASTATALHNAHQVVSLERWLGIFLEPAWQTFFHQHHSLLGIAVTWPRVLAVANNTYAYLHFIVPVLVALWIYTRHREHFWLLRNTIIFSILIAGIAYDLYPVTPPWLLGAMSFHGHPYHFPNTMPHVVGGLMLNGHPLGDNPNAAMPSLHTSWALIVAAFLIAVGRNPPAIIAGILYPCLILFAIVITSNHWILDAMAAVPTVLLAGALAFGTRWLWERREVLLALVSRRYHKTGNAGT